jgi:hypothetical protein
MEALSFVDPAFVDLMTSFFKPPASGFQAIGLWAAGFW